MIFPYVCNQTSNLHAYMELLVYKASAGSGKTFTLAVEYIKLLILNPRAYRQILAVTFTNKATAEMKERILTQLYGIWKEDPASDAYLKRIKEDLAKKPETASLSDRELRQRAGMALQYMLHDYSRFRVETIDSFFQSVMRNLARELELSPNLNIELNNAEVLSDAVDSMIEKLTPSSPVLAWLLDYINERIADDKRWNVSNEVKSFGRNIFDESYIERGEGLRFKLRSPETIKLYRDVLREMETDALEQMKGFYDQFEGELEGHALVPEDLKGGARGIGSYFRKLRDGRLADKDVLNATLQNCLADAKNWATKTSSRKDEIIRLAETSLIPLLQDAERFRPQKNRTINSCRLSLQHLNKLQLLNHIDEEVRTLNREHNRFLLSDTNALLHKLVHEGDSSFVFEKIGANIRNVMIDEFQDTSRMQWDNFRLLLLEGLSQGADSLIVGDVKQSIYRWRNGDWGILNSLGNDQSKVPLCDAKVPLYDAKPLHCESGVQLPFPFPVRVETLKTNRRSETNVIHFNNRLFTAAVDYLNALHLEELKEECIPLKRAYADVAQESPKTENKGYVKVSFLESDEEQNYTEKTLSAMGEEVQRLLSEDVKLNDITILVRKNKNIPPIADYFDKELHLPVVSDEAFRLDASLAICMLIDALRYLSNPEEKIARASLITNYSSPCSACRLAQTADRRCKDRASRRVRRPYGRIAPDASVRTVGRTLHTIRHGAHRKAGRLSVLFLRCGDRVPAKQLFRPRRFHPLLGRDALQQNHSQRRNGRHTHLLHPQVQGTGVSYRAHPLLRLETGERNIQPTGVVHRPRSAVQCHRPCTRQLLVHNGGVRLPARLPQRASAVVGG